MQHVRLNLLRSLKALFVCTCVRGGQTEGQCKMVSCDKSPHSSFVCWLGPRTEQPALTTMTRNGQTDEWMDIEGIVFGQKSTSTYVDPHPPTPPLVRLLSHPRDPDQCVVLRSAWITPSPRPLFGSFLGEVGEGSEPAVLAGWAVDSQPAPRGAEDEGLSHCAAMHFHYSPSAAPFPPHGSALGPLKAKVPRGKYMTGYHSLARQNRVHKPAEPSGVHSTSGLKESDVRHLYL